MPTLPTLEQAEERAAGIAAKLGYELKQWNGRWHWRKTSWRAGVWFAGDYASRLEALDGIVGRLGK